MEEIFSGWLVREEQVSHRVSMRHPPLYENDKFVAFTQYLKRKRAKKMMELGQKRAIAEIERNKATWDFRNKKLAFELLLPFKRYFREILRCSLKALKE